jgi:hypothetical protein
VGETVLTGSLEIRPEVVVRDHRSAVGGPVVRDHRGEVAAVSVRDHRRASFRARAIAADTMAASPQLMMRALAAEPAVDEPVVAEAVTDAPVARVMATAPRLQLTDLVDAEPVLVTREDTTVKSQAVAQLIEDQAPVLIAAVQQEEQTTSTQTVESHDLSLSLEYCFVQVSRDAWWNELFLTMPGWYAPGLKAGDFVPGRHLAGLAVGVPVAMLVTRNVRVSGHWSEADRAAASSHTSIGPWQMSESAMTVDEHEETTTLTMPGTQVVAVVCSLLPSLPPDDDPALAAAPPAEAATA